jgi:small subunit ribosomal protein S9
MMLRKSLSISRMANVHKPFIRVASSNPTPRLQQQQFHTNALKQAQQRQTYTQEQLEEEYDENEDEYLDEEQEGVFDAIEGDLEREEAFLEKDEDAIVRQLEIIHDETIREMSLLEEPGDWVDEEDEQEASKFGEVIAKDDKLKAEMDAFEKRLTNFEATAYDGEFPPFEIEGNESLEDVIDFNKHVEAEKVMPAISAYVEKNVNWAQTSKLVDLLKAKETPAKLETSEHIVQGTGNKRRQDYTFWRMYNREHVTPEQTDYEQQIQYFPRSIYGDNYEAQDNLEYLTQTVNAVTDKQLGISQLPSEHIFNTVQDAEEQAKEAQETEQENSFTFLMSKKKNDKTIEPWEIIDRQNQVEIQNMKQVHNILEEKYSQEVIEEGKKLYEKRVFDNLNGVNDEHISDLVQAHVTKESQRILNVTEAPYGQIFSRSSKLVDPLSASSSPTSLSGAVLKQLNEAELTRLETNFEERITYANAFTPDIIVEDPIDIRGLSEQEEARDPIDEVDEEAILEYERRRHLEVAQKYAADSQLRQLAKDMLSVDEPSQEEDYELQKQLFEEDLDEEDDLDLEEDIDLEDAEMRDLSDLDFEVLDQIDHEGKTEVEADAANDLYDDAEVNQLASAIEREPEDADLDEREEKHDVAAQLQVPLDDSVVDITKNRSEAQTRTDNLLLYSHKHSRYFLEDENVNRKFEEDLRNELKTKSLEEIYKTRPWLITDPIVRTIKDLSDNVNTEDVARPFSRENVQTLYKGMEGKEMENIKEFYASFKDSGNRESLLNRLELLIPLMNRERLGNVLDKLIDSVVQKHDAPQMLEAKNYSGTLRSIMALSDKLNADSQSRLFTIADMVTKPRPKIEAVMYCVDQITKGKVDFRTLQHVAELGKVLNERDYETEWDYLYDVLKPIHTVDETQVTTVQGRKSYQPRIYSGTVRASGKRKTSIAHVTLTPGTGIFSINGRSYLEYFKSRMDLLILGYPFRITQSFNQFDVYVRVAGGGTTGQRDAIKLAISKALAKFIPEYGYALSANGMMTVDSRIVERKKYGRVKARRSAQWVKR